MQLNESQVFKLSVVVSNPNHPVDAKRTERKMKVIRVRASNRSEAIASVRTRLTKRGLKVHQVTVSNIMSESEDSKSEYGFWDPARKALYDKYKNMKPDTPEEAKKRRQQGVDALKAIKDLATQLKKRKEG